MLAIFGRAFEASYGQIGGEAFKVWAGGLEKLSDKNLMHGLSRVTKNAQENAAKGRKTFPPCLPEFLAMCKRQVKHPSHRMFLPTPDYSDLRAAGRDKIRELRRQLGR